MKTTLLMTTYNWPQALGMVLASVSRQTVLPDEIVIADDGSIEETKMLIEHFAANFPHPVIHVWQKDLGFRKTAILNKAIAKSYRRLYYPDRWRCSLKFSLYCRPY